MLNDIRLAFRAMRADKSFTLAALLTLALGIGATTAIFSVVYGVLVRPLPFPDPDRLVQLSEVVPGGTPALPGQHWISNLSVHAWDPHRRTIGRMATFSTGSATVGVDPPRQTPGGSVAPHFFDVLGVQPVMGRFFVPEDAAPGAAPVVVVSRELWTEILGGDPRIIGRTLVIDERPHEIVGVAPAGLGVPLRETRFWTPLNVAPLLAANGRDTRVEGSRAIARLVPGVTPEQAAAEGTALARGVSRPRAADLLFGTGGPVEIRVRTLRDQMTEQVRPALLVLLVGVALLMLIACANVANLFLSRGVSRERDFAVRVALGAARGRLVREALTDSLVMAAIGGLLGMALAWALVGALPAAAPDDFPRLDAVQLDWRALTFAVVASMAAGVLSGLAPALRGSRSSLLPALREGIGASSSRRTRLVRRGLLVAQASLAVMLLVGAALLGRSFTRLVQTDPGFDAAHVLSARIYLPGASRGQAQADAFLAELLARVRALPGVTAAGAGNMAPLGASTYMAGFTLPVPGRDAVTGRALSYVVTPGYAETLALRLRAGRTFEARDETSGVQPWVVNDQFVATFLQGVEPIGFRFPGSVVTSTPASAEIVGVVGNVLKDGLDQPPQAEVYVLPALGATIRREVYLVLRSQGDPIAHADAVRRIVAEIRGDAAVDRVEPLQAQMADSVAQPRFAASVLLAFAVLALGLAAVGLYGVLSYMVARRQREIGVRGALGATRANIVALVVREGMAVAVAGLAVGLVSAAALTRLMQAALYGVQPLDPVSFVAAPAVLIVVALVACTIPARRAAAIDPAHALRRE